MKPNKDDKTDYYIATGDGRSLPFLRVIRFYDKNNKFFSFKFVIPFKGLHFVPNVTLDLAEGRIVETNYQQKPMYSIEITYHQDGTVNYKDTLNSENIRPKYKFPAIYNLKSPVKLFQISALRLADLINQDIWGNGTGVTIKLDDYSINDVVNCTFLVGDKKHSIGTKVNPKNSDIFPGYTAYHFEDDKEPISLYIHIYKFIGLPENTFFAICDPSLLKRTWEYLYALKKYRWRVISDEFFGLYLKVANMVRRYKVKLKRSTISDKP